MKTQSKKIMRLTFIQIRKSLLTFFLFCCFPFAKGQSQPTVDNYFQPSSVKLCALNHGFQIERLNLSSVAPLPAPFSLSLQVFVVTSLPPPGQLLPYPWQTLYPNCNTQGGTGSNPIELSNCTVSLQCTPQSVIPSWNTVNYSFDWQLSCSSNIIEAIDYDIYLDCSIFTMINNPAGSLYLIQQWYYIASPFAVPIPFATQPLPIPITFPHFIAPNYLNVDANYDYTENWRDFIYQNTGTGPANILTDFYVETCSEYNLLNTYYVVNSTGVPPLPSSTSWLPYQPLFSTTLPIIQPNHFLIIRQEVKITGCAPDCGPRSYPLPVLPPKNAHFRWRCNLPLPNAFCSNCYEQDYVTELHFINEQPKYTVTRTNPSYDQALHNTDCIGTLTTPNWEIKVTNTSQFTTLPEIKVELSNPYAQSLSIISENSIGFVATATSCVSCSYTDQTPPPVTLNYPLEISNCATAVLDPVSKFTITINDLKPTEYVTFKFEEYHCCGNDPSAANNQFDAPKFFNQWQLTSVCTTACGEVKGPDGTATNHAVISGVSGISGYASNPIKDIDLNLVFSNPNSHTVVAAPGCPDPYPYPYFGPPNSPLIYSATVTELFGNQDDEQALGFAQTPSSDISGIIKVDVEMIQAGMLLANPFDVFFEIPHPTIPNSFVYWRPMLNGYFASDFPCTSFPYSPTSGPCFYPPNNSPNPTTCPTNGILCEPKTYCVYFNTADLLALGIDPSNVFYPSSPTNQPSKFKFRFYACCSSYAQTPFKISFSLFPNTDDCALSPITSCTPVNCFIPLSTVDDHTTVHCPGCRAPGIIVNSYRMERMSLGFEDNTDNRIADNSTNIQYSPGSTGPGPYGLNYFNLAFYRSTFGDLLNDFTIANFTDGDNTTGGYDYCVMQNQTSPINLDVVQLYREFPFSGTGTGNFDVQVLGFDFYIDEDATGNCIDCDVFYYSPLPVYKTIFRMHVDLTTLPACSTFYERGLSPNDDKFLFTFTESALTSLIASQPSCVTNFYVDPGVSSIDFQPNQVYRMRTYYSVCGNYNNPLSNNLPDFIKESDITDFMYLIGAARTLYTPNGGVLGNLPATNRMPNTINAMENDLPYLLTFGYTPTSQCTTMSDPPCNNCTTVANQNNFGDAYYFFCEPSGGRHEFYGTDCINNTLYQTQYANDCDYQMQILISNTIQRKTHNTGTNNEYFPYEYKPLNIFPHQVTLDPPAGWHFVTNGGNVDLTIYNVGIGIPSIVQVPFTSNPLQFNLTDHSSPAPIFPNYNCITSPPSGSLFIGDEYQFLSILVPLEANVDCPDNPSILVIAESEVEFKENTEACQNSSLACAISDIQQNVNNSGNNHFSPPNPNLNCQIWPASINASTNTITWNFEFHNPAISGNNTVTDAKNVYIAIPQVGYLSNWEANYTITGVYPYPWLTTTYSTTINNLLPVNDYFWFLPVCAPFPVYPCSYLSVGGSITQATITAEYDPCTDPAEFDFIWGWNCTKETVYPTMTDLCMEIESHHSINNKVARLVTNVASSVLPTDYTACEPAQHITACFKNITNAELKPTLATITVNPGVNLTVVPNSLSISACGGSATYQINQSGVISVTNGNGFMHNGDCFCIEFDVDIGCNFGDLQLPTVTIQWDDYCGNSSSTVYNLPIIPPSPTQPTLCTDCFMLTKTANPDPVIEDIELVHFNFIIASNNTTATSTNVYLGDNYPVGGITIPGIDPFFGGLVQFNLTGQQTITLTNYVEGFLNTSGLNCNEAYLITCPNCTLYSQVCVDVWANCSSQSNFTIGPAGALYSSVAANIAAATTIDVQGVLIIDQPANLTGKTFKMEPGTQILVDPSITLSLTNCDLNECSKMWKGVRLLNNIVTYKGGILSMRGGSITGAEYAVKAPEFSTATLGTVRLENNYVGIYMPPPQVSFLNTAAVSVGRCTFTGNGTMPLPYQGQTTTLGDIPLAGIEAVGSILNLQQSNPTVTNTFDNLSNGVIGRSSTLYINNCYFLNIQPDEAYIPITISSNPLVLFNGSGIYGLGFSIMFKIVQAGFGNQPMDDKSFDYCHYGIFADRTILNSTLNHMVNVNTAYRAQFCKRDVSITSNLLDTWHDAIQLLFCDGSQQTIVWNNNITFGNSDPLMQYAGVRIEENQALNNNSQVKNNTINFRAGASAAYTGISSNSTFDFEITWNEINMVNNDFNLNGIYMEGCSRNNASCNSIYSSLAADQPDIQSAISNKMGDSPIIGCNFMDQTNNGIFMIGPIGNHSDIRGNKFNYHNNALRYSTSAIVNMLKDYQGNLWFQPSISPTGFNALNENSGGNPVFNKVEGTAPPLMPYSQDPINFFQTIPSPTEDDFDCEIPIDYCNEFVPDCPFCRTGMDDMIASNTIENEPYTEETRWILKSGLFARLHDNPSLLTDSLMDIFYTTLQGSAIAEFKNIGDDKANLFYPDSTLSVLIEQGTNSFNAQIELFQEQLELLDTALAVNDTASAASIINTINVIRGNMQTTILSMNNIASSINNTRNDQADDIDSQNAQVSETNNIELNESLVNDIYLATIARDIFEFDSYQSETLYDIATQCPLAGGNAVFRARALYFLIDQGLQYNDFEKCNLEGSPLKQVSESLNQDKTLKAHIYPNPASNEATLEYDIPDSEFLEFKLMSTTDQSLLSKQLIGGKNSYTFSTAFLSPGVYYYSLISKNKSPLFIGKLVIIR